MARPTAILTTFVFLLCAVEASGQATGWPPSTVPAWYSSAYPTTNAGPIPRPVEKRGQTPQDIEVPANGSPATYPATNAPPLPLPRVRIAPATYPVTGAAALEGTWGSRCQLSGGPQPIRPGGTAARFDAAGPVASPYPNTRLPSYYQFPPLPPPYPNQPRPSGNSHGQKDSSRPEGSFGASMFPLGPSRASRTTAPGGNKQRSKGTFGASMFPVTAPSETRATPPGRPGAPLQVHPAAETEPGTESKAPQTKDAMLDTSVRCVQPYWDGAVDLVGLRRRKANDYLLITDQATGVPVVNALDLDFDYKLGAHVDLIHYAADGVGWQIEYLGIPSWDGRQVVTGALQLNGPGFDLAVDPAVFSVDYSTSLYSVELSASRHDGYRWSCFAGFRYIRLNDDLLVAELNAPFPDVLDVDTENNLYGMQMGGDLLVYDRGGPLRGSIALKAGIYTNDVRQHTRSALVLPEVNAHARKAVFAGEMEFLLTYQITKRLKVRGSYKLVGLGSVALAPDQIGATDLSTSRAAIHYNGLLLDGGLLGVEYVW